MNKAEEIAAALKPLRCPKCGARIYYLIYYAEELVEATAYLSEGHLEYSGWQTLSINYDAVRYCCPVCNRVLFRDERKAEKFLKGEG